MRGCTKCAARQARLATVSEQIALAMRPSGLAPWKPAPPVGLLGSIPLAMKLLLISALLLITLTATILVANVMRTTVHHAPRPGTLGLCRPDLPNDKCQ
jgi:hypothetical protein